MMGLSVAPAMGQLQFDPTGLFGPANWNLTMGNAVWNGGAGAVAWTNGNAAVFSNGVVNALTLTEGVSALSLLQSGAGTQTTIGGAGQTLALTGTGTVVGNTGNQWLTLASGLKINLAPGNAALPQMWQVGTGTRVVVDAVLEGNVGTGGLVKVGEGILELNGSNTYVGTTVLDEGILQLGSAGALGGSTLSFKGGTLRYGFEVPGGFASKFEALTTDAAIFDTNGFDITLDTALGGTGGLTKRGDGILTLAASNTMVGDIRVEGGVLKASSLYSAAEGGALNTPFGPKGTNGNKIYVSDGATLDLNGGYSNTSATGNNYGGGKYEITVTGHGVGGTGAIRNTGAGMSNFGPFSKVTFLGDTTLGVTSRWDLIATEIAASDPFDLIKVGGGQLAWGVSSATNNLKDIYVKAGSIAPISGNNYGDVTASIIISSGASLAPWAGQTLSKKIVLNAENASPQASISANGDGTSITDYSLANLNGQITLSGPSMLTTNNGRRDLKINGEVTGAGTLRISGVVNAQTGTDTAVEKRRSAIIYLTNAGNSFTGEVIIERGILRMADGTFLADGTTPKQGRLGTGANKVTMNNTDANQPAIFDLFGSNQSVGSLHATTANNFIENDKAGSTSRLQVGSDNTASASFAGKLRDSSVMLPYNVTYGSTAGVGTTGVLAFEKVGTGRQILTAVNTFSGGTTVTSGQLQIGQGTSSTSTARLGNGKFIVNGGSLTGNGIVGHAGLQSEVNVGGSLIIGNFDQTAAQVLSVEGRLKNEGLLAFDVFAVTNGSGSGSNSDVLRFVNNEMQLLGGILELVDRTNSSLTWGLDTWFQVIDWSNVSEANRDVSLTMGSMPALNSAYSWDLSRLESDGRVYVVTAVPEPGRAVLGLLALSMAIFARRRRRA